MGSSDYNNTSNNSSNNNDSGAEQNNNNNKKKHQYQREPPMSSSSFSDYITRLVTGRLPQNIELINMTDSLELKSSVAPDDSFGKEPTFVKLLEAPQLPPTPPSPPQPPPPPPPQPASFSSWPKRPCRAPLLRKFAHPCTCGQANTHNRYLPPHSTSNNNNNNNYSTGHLPPAAYTSPLYLYDPHTKKCLPTSRSRDMLLKECHSHAINTFPVKIQHQSAPCVYDDLVCDARRNRCACPTSSSDGRVNCRSGYVYNVISKDCQKIFDINELPPSYTAGVSATQFSFVTIVLIWILLLILIVTAKLRKLRTSNLYRNSPATERRLHQGGGNSYRHQSQTASTWLHPFIAAVNGHHHLNQHRTTVDRNNRTLSLDESGNYNDTDFFLTNGNLRINDMLSDNNFVGSQHSLNNPPPKFEEIYPSCPEEQQQQQQQQQQSQTTRPPSNEDLPSYDEAMKLQNTMPPDQSKE